MTRRAKSDEAKRLDEEKYSELQHRLVLETFEQPLLTHAEERVLGRRVELMTHLEERMAKANGDTYCAVMLLRETATYRRDADLAWQALGARGEEDAPTLAQLCGDPEFRREIDCRAVTDDEPVSKRARHEEKRRKIGETHDGRIVLLSVATALTPPILISAAARIAWETGSAPTERQVNLHHIWDTMNNPGTGAIIHDAAERHNDEVSAHFNQIMRQGEDAVRELAERNTRLVMSIAKGYAYHDLEITDLFQEGNIGLVKAIERYDYRRGYKFSTYATWWIRQSVSRNLGNERNIRLPDGVSAMLRKMARVEGHLSQQLGTESIDDESIANEMDVSADKIRELRKIRADTQSLDEQLTARDGEESSTTRGDLLTDRKPGTEVVSLQHVVNSELRSIMEQTLSHEELAMLIAEFSFTEYAEDTPRNRKAVNQAVDKLRDALASIGIRELADFMPTD